MRRILLHIGYLLALTAGIANAQAPGQIGFQGLLYDNGTPANTYFAFVLFSIYSQEDSGTALWQAVQGVNVSDGQFFVYLGQTNAAAFEALAFDVQYWVEMNWTQDDASTSPRVKLLGVPYARTAARADAVPWSGLSGMPAEFSDGTDDASHGDSYNCYKYIIPYMPYSNTVSQVIYFANFGNLQKSVYTIDTSQSDQPELRSSAVSLGGTTADLTVSAQWEGNPSDDFSIETMGAGVTKLQSLLETQLTDIGFDGTGKVSFSFRPAVTGFYAVHAAFNAGPREHVRVECVR